MMEIIVSYDYEHKMVEVGITKPYTSWRMPMNQFFEFMETGNMSAIQLYNLSGIELSKDKFETVMNNLFKERHRDIDVLDIKNAMNLLFYAEDSYIYCKNIRTGEQVIVGKVGE